jgi:hypothetical protein
MMKRTFLLASLIVALVAAVGVAAVVFVVPRVAAGAAGGPGCVDGGKGYVGIVPGTTERLNWHGTYIIGLCPGATGPQAGDSDVQTITYADGTYERYKIVYSTDDLTASNGVFCYWDLTTDPSLSGSGYHCPSGSANDDFKWYIVSSSGTSPYLEPAQSGGWKSRPNGIGVYK